MKNRAVRIALLLLVALGVAAAGYELSLLERQSEAAARSRRIFDDKARHAEGAVRELRAAEFAYLAVGQGSSFWTTRAGSLIPAIASDIKSICEMDEAAAAARSGGTICPRGREALATLQRIDTSVQGYLQNEQPLLASDIVFTDLREANQALIAWIDEARQRRADADGAAAETLQKRRTATAAGVAVFVLLVLVLLTPIGNRGPAFVERPAGGPARGETLPSIGAASYQAARGVLGDIAPDDRAVRDVSELSLHDLDSTLDQPPVPLAAAAPWPPATPAPAERVRGEIDLAAAAALCTDLACVHDTKGLAPLLERVAALLDAAGIIVWVNDTATGLLRPALSHGYSKQALARIDGIAKDADNATASACRDRRLRVVEGEGSSSGALAVPLLWPDGCLGVMTAEVRHGRERDSATQAVATMIAAQMASLITPQSAAGAP